MTPNDEYIVEVLGENYSVLKKMLIGWMINHDIQPKQS